MSKHQCHVLISGQVQGVSFRASTQKNAAELNITGHIINLPDGRVEALFQGSESAIRKMLGWCKRGPREAQVEHVKIEWQEPEKNFDTFQVLHDGGMS